MGGTNCVDRLRTRSILNVITYARPIVIYSNLPLQGELVTEDANVNVREVSSAPNQNDEHRGQATTAVNSVLASVYSECEWRPIPEASTTLPWRPTWGDRK